MLRPKGQLISIFPTLCFGSKQISLSLSLCVRKKPTKKKLEEKEMAYRRRQGISRASTFKEEIHHPPDDNDSKTFTSSYSFSSSTSPANSLAAQAIRASAAARKTDSPAFAAHSDFGPSRSKVFFFPFVYWQDKTNAYFHYHLDQIPCSFYLI